MEWNNNESMNHGTSSTEKGSGTNYVQLKNLKKFFSKQLSRSISVHSVKFVFIRWDG
jgi:hypothetical protein